MELHVVEIEKGHPGLRYIMTKDTPGHFTKDEMDKIALRCNSHETFLVALENLREELDEDHIHNREDCTGDCPICVIDDALKQAEKH